MGCVVECQSGDGQPERHHKGRTVAGCCPVGERPQMEISDNMQPSNDESGGIEFKLKTDNHLSNAFDIKTHFFIGNLTAATCLMMLHWKKGRKGWNLEEKTGWAVIVQVHKHISASKWFSVFKIFTRE